MDERAKKEDELAVSWSDLPLDILKFILSGLPISDYPYVSSVCKSWNSITPTTYPVYRNPLLLQFKKTRNNKTLCHCYDPFLNMTFIVHCPINLSGYTITNGKGKWILAYNHFYVKLINPFSGVFHQYQYGIMVGQGFTPMKAAFCGDPPDNCLIFLIDNLNAPANGVEVCFYNGDNWLHRNFTCNTPFKITPWSDPIFFNDNVYCLGTKGVIGRFAVKKNSWELLEKIRSKSFIVDCKDSFLVESRNQLLVLQIRNNGKSISIFRLDQADMTWHKTYNLDDQSLFVSKRTISVAPVDENFKNKVYLPWFCGVSDITEADLVNSNGQFFFLPKSLLDSSHQGATERRNTHQIYCYSMEKGRHSGYLAYTVKSHSIWFHHVQP